MSLLSVRDIACQAGTKHLFDGLSFHLEAGDHIGLVGHNGSGKTTLLRLLCGDLLPDSGQIDRQRGLRIGVVEQFLPPALESGDVLRAVIDALDIERRDDGAWQAELLLGELGIDQMLHGRPIASLSGGQKNLVLLARAMMGDPELLLLDEPGNHMDAQAIAQLKNYLGGAAVPAFLMISHDRDLLDSVTNRTLWLRDQRCYSFALPYSRARGALQAADTAAEQARASEEKEIARVRASAKRLAVWGRLYDNESLSRKARSMERRAARLEAEVTFVSAGSGLSLGVDTEAARVRQLFTLEDAEIQSPGGQVLFQTRTLVFRPGDRVALLGVNGAGKSSLVRALLTAHALPAGEQTTLRFNPTVRIGYFDQELAGFDGPESVIDWLRPRTRQDDGAITRALIRAGVAYADHTRPVKVLSGGEKARLILLTFQLEQPNLLIMDEPTNHIDLAGKEELEADLLENGVSLLFTSHDQRFIENVATRYWWIREGALREVHDPAEYFAVMGESRPAFDQTSATVREPVRRAGQNSDALLERVVELEELLAADRARNPRHQKPALQARWEAELAALLSQLT
ncbi:MAG: ABC-F family ATP-binding cassette domain-containing protein [Pseudomonadales bacterium]|nr:ABC-F family ATP-binding cassette domain-containing protein [Pseudomonadales bacterium]